MTTKTAGLKEPVATKERPAAFDSDEVRVLHMVGKFNSKTSEDEWLDERRADLNQWTADAALAMLDGETFGENGDLVERFAAMMFWWMDDCQRCYADLAKDSTEPADQKKYQAIAHAAARLRGRFAKVAGFPDHAGA